jgi:rare lipoprotein A
MSPRARGATTALGALCFATIAGAPHAADAATITRDHARLNVVAGRRASLTGRVTSAIAGQVVVLQRRGHRRWVRVARTMTGAGGRFEIRFRPPRAGTFALRLVSGGTHRAVGRLNVYRHAAVSWYGPGLYGNKLSCGGTLTPGTLGVAHRTLPCGTPVALFLGGKTVTVPVVDRGPFANGARYDLTSAAAESLGMAQSSVVGVVPMRGAPMPAPTPSPYAGTGGITPPAP